MEVIVIESSAWKTLMFQIERAQQLAEQVLTGKKMDDPYLSTNEVYKYTGYGQKWLEARQDFIGYYQDGKEKRFKRSAVDVYMEKHHIQQSANDLGNLIKKKPLWKDEAALAAGLQEFVAEHNAKLMLQSKNANSNFNAPKRIK